MLCINFLSVVNSCVHPSRASENRTKSISAKSISEVGARSGSQQASTVQPRTQGLGTRLSTVVMTVRCVMEAWNKHNPLTTLFKTE